MTHSNQTSSTLRYWNISLINTWCPVMNKNTQSCQCSVYTKQGHSLCTALNIWCLLSLGKALGEKTGSGNAATHCLCRVAMEQAPVPLSIFRSNSKFDENSERSSFKYIRPITTIFCTRHDSDTVVTCAKYRCDRPRIFYTRVFWIFIEFRIRSKYA